MAARLALLLTGVFLLAHPATTQAQTQAPVPAPAPDAIPPTAPAPVADATPASPPAPAASPADPLSSLDPAQVQELFQWLSRHAVDPDALSQDALNRAALRSLLQDGRTGATLLPAPAAGSANPDAVPLFAALGKHAAYFRPGRLEPAALAPAAAFLTALPAETDTLILDLRVPLTNAPLSGSAALNSLFLPENTTLFQIKNSAAAPAAPLTTTGPRAWSRRVWLLIDNQTPPALDLAAHCLVRHAGALTFGSPTPGLLTDFTERPLGSTHLLRLPSATVTWPDGTRLTGTPLTPTFPIKPVPAARQALLSLTDSTALAPLLQETDRPRPNEAALMAGLPPELIEDSPSSTTSPVRLDPVLQQALDLVETTRFLKLDP